MNYSTNWKQAQSYIADAIIAIDESGYGHLMVMLTPNEAKHQLHEEYDCLSDLQFTDTTPGLYYANIEMRAIYEDIEVDWIIVKPLYSICETEYIKLTVTSYNVNSNNFNAITSTGETVIFDPFIECLIDMTDDEYYSQTIAPYVVGHKFVVTHLSPLKEDCIFTTFKLNKEDLK